MDYTALDTVFRDNILTFVRCDSPPVSVRFMMNADGMLRVPVQYWTGLNACKCPMIVRHNATCTHYLRIRGKPEAGCLLLSHPPMSLQI